MMTNAILTIHRQLADARRRHRENDAHIYLLLMERESIENEMEALQVRYMDALEAPRLREQGAAAIVRAELVLGDSWRDTWPGGEG